MCRVLLGPMRHLAKMHIWQQGQVHLTPCATLQKCTSDIREKYTTVTTSRSNRLLLGNNNHLSKPDKGLRVTTSAWHSCRNKHNSVLHGSRDSVVGVVTRLRAGRSGVRIPVGPEYFYLLQFVHTGFEAQTVSYSIGTGALSHRQSGRSAKLTTRLIRVLRLRLASFFTSSSPICHYGIDKDNSTFQCTIFL